MSLNVAYAHTMGTDVESIIRRCLMIEVHMYLCVGKLKT